MRNKRLDVLRCIAVLLVLACHDSQPSNLEAAGWVGVDLFFVLSGFLISGLLFTEHQKHGSINFKRFLIRRGLKIYPAFYFLLLVTFFYQIIFHQLGSRAQYLSELFYVQNYGQTLWGHTWSLAVEEHFYILLASFFLLVTRLSANRTDSFHVIPRAFLILAVACLGLRVIAVSNIPPADLILWKWHRWAYATTHCRMDSLFFGVLLGYYHHFRPDVLARLFDSSRKKLLAATLAAILLSSCIFFPSKGRFMLTMGFPILYFGFGIVLILSLRVRSVLPSWSGKQLSMIGGAFAYAGMYSYSIYLWHLPVQGWGSSFTDRVLRLHPGHSIWLFAYLVGSIVVGIILARLVEFPVLRLRDRLFPSFSSSLPRISESELSKST